jgi:DMSO/TMAO reductase YedYZ molybdopterin-dependent catalytic subunit
VTIDRRKLLTIDRTDGRDIDRRDFLIRSGGLVSAAFLAACDSNPKAADKLLNYAERKNIVVERELFRHTAMDVVQRGAHDAGNKLPSYYISPTVPTWDESVRGKWALELSGLVGNPLRLTLEDLQRLPQVSNRVNHYCVEGWTAVETWTGVPFRELARLVRADPHARFVDFQSFDEDYHESWDIESAMHRQTVVAYGLDGKMLEPAHGAPARVYSPVKLGYKNTKYLTKIVFMPQANGGYWTDRGYEWYGGV